MREEELERQWELILGDSQVVRDREYPFSKDLIVDSPGSVDLSLRVLAKVSAWLEALRFGGSYELVHRLWSQFTLIAGQPNLYVTWSRDECLTFAILYVIIPVAHCCFAFSQSSSTAFWARSSLGQRLMATVALSFRSGANTSGPSFGVGTTTSFQRVNSGLV